LDVLGYDSDLDQYRRYKCTPTDNVEACASLGGENKGELTDGERQAAKKLQDDAKSPQMLQWVGYGVGAALVGAGVYLYYRTYMDEGLTGNEQALAKRIRLAPVITPSGGGLAARLTF